MVYGTPSTTTTTTAAGLGRPCFYKGLAECHLVCWGGGGINRLVYKMFCYKMIPTITYA